MRRLGLILLVFVSYSAWSQTSGKWSQYYVNPFFINPASTASSEKSSINIGHRSQWSGLDQGLKVSSVNLEVPLRFKSVGLGVGLVNDVEYGQKTVSSFLSASYKINLWSGKLHYGMYFGAQQYSQNTDLFVAQNQSDVAFQKASIIVPDLGAGLLYLGKKLEAFLSAKHLIQSSYFESNLMRQHVHYYFGTSYEFLEKGKYKVKPISVFRYVHELPLQAQLGVVFEKEGVFFTALQWSTGKDVSANAGFNLAPYIGQDIQLSYAYEWSWSELANYHRGTHEFMIKYCFHKKPDIDAIRKKKPIKQLIEF